MRALRVSGLLALLTVASCGDEVTAPPLSEPATVESTTAASIAVPAPSSAGPAASISEPSVTAGDPVETQTTVSEPSTTTTTTIARPLSGPIVLRGDGLGNARFGDPMSEVEPWLVRELGAPVWESVARRPLAASQWYEAQDLFRSLTFELGELSTETGHVTGMTVRFSDVSDARDDDVVHLASWSTWHVGTEALDIASGVRIGMTRAELEERFPSVVITPEHPGSERFEIVDGDDGAAGLRGVLWDERGVVSFEAGARGRDHDDIPAARPTPDGPIVADLALRADGLGDVEFQGPADDLVRALSKRFGLPAEETNVRARPGVPMRGPLGYFPESEVRQLRWYDPGLTIVVADGQHYGGTEPGDLRLVYWSTSSSRLRLETGVGVGSTLSELIGAYPAVNLGYSDECVGAYFPASFYVDTEAGRFDGSVDWDWVSDVQRALNARGATLVVDGEYGARTRAAVEAFQIEAAIDSTAWYDGHGEAGPLTLDALGIAPPADAYVAGLRAGSTGSC